MAYYSVSCDVARFRVLILEPVLFSSCLMITGLIQQLQNSIYLASVLDFSVIEPVKLHAFS